MITDTYVIQTEFLGPDDLHGSRIKATWDQSAIIIDRDMSKRIEECHEQAAEMVAKECGLKGALIGGEKGGGGYVFILLDKYNPLIKAANALSNLLDKEAGHYTPISGDDWDNERVKNGLEIVSEVLKITENMK